METVKIKATPEVVKMAKLAVEIQDACNPAPVITALEECRSHFASFGEDNGQERTGTAMAIQNPISKALIDKLCSLARMKLSCDFWHHSACSELADGIDVDWEIDFS